MGSLEGRRILITRDASQAGGLKEKLASRGAEILSIPTIAISDPPDWTPFDQAVGMLSTFEWIVFSSVNAVRKTSDRLTTLNTEMDRFNAVKIAVVGDQTAEAVREKGWRVDLIPDQYQAEGLLVALKQSGISGKRIWIPRALKARRFLIDELEKSGSRITETPVYQNTIPYENRNQLQQALLSGKIDWITFTSSSTVTHFFKILGDTPWRNPIPKLASIGQITTKTLTQYGLIPSVTADPQNINGLCQGILDWESAASASTSEISTGK
ncbi:uroporphyrinogen-III synthase [bacterium]|nr:uroporphyrinogen-III synthase [bacterium]